MRHRLQGKIRSAGSRGKAIRHTLRRKCESSDCRRQVKVRDHSLPDLVLDLVPHVPGQLPEPTVPTALDRPRELDGSGDDVAMWASSPDVALLALMGSSVLLDVEEARNDAVRQVLLRWRIWPGLLCPRAPLLIDELRTCVDRVPADWNLPVAVLNEFFAAEDGIDLLSSLQGDCPGHLCCCVPGLTSAAARCAFSGRPQIARGASSAAGTRSALSTQATRLPATFTGLPPTLLRLPLTLARLPATCAGLPAGIAGLPSKLSAHPRAIAGSRTWLRRLV
mmetsp:Transcript_70522/g.181756  ORF Transcript_70522/g.181756 Transcript_70522/m.181756 type:complete len:279 (+) Transcript_70522:112-948(+)